MFTLTRLTHLALASVTLATNPGNVALEFGPDEGAAWTKTCERSLELTFEELSVVMGGQPVPSEYLPELNIEVSESDRRVFTDRVVSAEDGRHTRLERTFDEIEVEKSATTEMIMMGQEPDVTAARARGISPLEGETVVFSWDDDSEAYEVEWADKDGAASALEGLIEDTDARALLPGDELEVGDSWTVAFEDVPLLFDVGGDLALELEGDHLEEFESESDDEEYEGELELTLTDVSESDDGAQLAVVEIAGELVERSTVATDLEGIPVVDGDATQHTVSTFDVSGELVWDLSERRLHALALRRDVEMVVVMRKDEGQEGPEFESTHVLRGATILEVSAAPAD